MDKMEDLCLVEEKHFLQPAAAAGPAQTRDANDATITAVDWVEGHTDQDHLSNQGTLHPPPRTRESRGVAQAIPEGTGQ